MVVPRRLATSTNLVAELSVSHIQTHIRFPAGVELRAIALVAIPSAGALDTSWGGRGASLGVEQGVGGLVVRSQEKKIEKKS